MVIGIPKAMLYYRNRILWETFFREIGVELIFSPDTDRRILEQGSSLAEDEMCLSSKVFIGHVNALIGKCDYILVPRIVDFGLRREMCTTFAALYDVVRNIFRGTDQKFIAYSVDVRHGQDEQAAFITMASELGVPRRSAKKAYKAAVKADSADWKDQLKKQKELAKTDATKVLIASHSYVLQDPFVGGPVVSMLEEMGVVVLTADITDRGDARKRAEKFSPTMKWEFSREIIGGLLDGREADGIIFVSAFPCGPDSMVTELFLRKQHDKPVLNLVLDGQSGTAGLETRIESFVDILCRRQNKNGTLSDKVQENQNVNETKKK